MVVGGFRGWVIWVGFVGGGAVRRVDAGFANA